MCSIETNDVQPPVTGAHIGQLEVLLPLYDLHLICWWHWFITEEPQRLISLSNSVIFGRTRAAAATE